LAVDAALAVELGNIGDGAGARAGVEVDDFLVGVFESYGMSLSVDGSKKSFASGKAYVGG